MAETWWEYATTVAGESRQDIAAAAGVDPSQVSRWSKGENPNAKAVVAFARHHSRPPIEALIAAGYLAPSDIGGVVTVRPSRSSLSTPELLAEIKALWIELKQRLPVDELPTSTVAFKQRPTADKPAANHS